jgi:hypothetical protein
MRMANYYSKTNTLDNHNENTTKSKRQEQSWGRDEPLQKETWDGHQKASLCVSQEAIPNIKMKNMVLTLFNL